jgi:acyl carrier protein
MSGITAEGIVRWLRENNPAVGHVDPDANLLAEGIIDSFKFVGFLLHLESLLGRPIEREKVVPESFQSVNRILANFAGSA